MSFGGSCRWIFFVVSRQTSSFKSSYWEELIVFSVWRECINLILIDSEQKHLLPKQWNTEHALFFVFFFFFNLQMQVAWKNSKLSYSYEGFSSCDMRLWSPTRQQDDYTEPVSGSMNTMRQRCMEWSTGQTLACEDLELQHKRGKCTEYKYNVIQKD